MYNISPLWVRGIGFDHKPFKRLPPAYDDLVQWIMKKSIYESDDGEWFWRDSVGDQLRNVYLGSYGEFDSTNYVTFDDLTDITISDYTGTTTLTISGNTITATAGTCSYIELSNGSIYDFEEGSGTLLQDKSANSLNGTISDTTDFWATSIGIRSYKNENGFNIDDGTYTGTYGAFIPRLETTANLSNSVKTQVDIYGNVLSYYGRARLDAQATASNCITSTGDTSLTFDDLTDVTITTYTGNAVPTINGNTVELAGGDALYIELSNGFVSYYSEGEGDVLYSKGDDGLTATISASDVWSTSDIQTPINIFDGFDIWSNDTTAEYLRVPYTSNGVSNFTDGDTIDGYTWVSTHQGTSSGYNQAETILVQPTAPELYMTLLLEEVYNAVMYDSDGDPVSITCSDIQTDYSDAHIWFANTYSREPVVFNSLVYSTAQSGTTLDSIYTYIHDQYIRDEDGVTLYDADEDDILIANDTVVITYVTDLVDDTALIDNTVLSDDVIIQE